jgi:hypothetical protein
LGHHHEENIVEVLLREDEKVRRTLKGSIIKDSIRDDTMEI